MTVGAMIHLTRAFFAHPTLTVARELLGKRLVKLEPEGKCLAGTIVEVEAYIGETDLACHARFGRTERNQVMYSQPGTAYVYFTYGMHWMLNFVTEREGFPAAVLLRGVHPTEGLDVMRQRRPRPELGLADGPAKLTQSFAIDHSWNGHELCAPDARLFLEDGLASWPTALTTGPRVGLDRTPEPWRSLPWSYQCEHEF